MQHGQLILLTALAGAVLVVSIARACTVFAVSHCYQQDTSIRTHVGSEHHLEYNQITVHL
jgi:hypothetical protein